MHTARSRAFRRTPATLSPRSRNAHVQIVPCSRSLSAYPARPETGAGLRAPYPDAPVSASALHCSWSQAWTIRCCARRHGGVANKKLVSQAKGAAALVRAMHDFEAREQLQVEACAALANLAAGDAACKQGVADAMGASAMCHAMGAHPDSDEVQQQGCRGLLNLSTGGGKCERAVMDAKGAKMAVAAMLRHPADPGVQWLGDPSVGQSGHASALGLVARSGRPPGPNSPRSPGCGMPRMTACPSLRRAGCRVLANVACGPSDGRVAVRLASGAEAVCATMQTHTVLPHQLEACRALAFIVGWQVSRRAPTFLAGWQRWLGVPPPWTGPARRMRTQRPPFALQAAGDANDKESVRATDAPALVVKAMCDFPLQDDLQEIALGVLVGLSQGDAKCKQAVKEAAKGQDGTSQGLRCELAGVPCLTVAFGWLCPRLLRAANSTPHSLTLHAGLALAPPPSLYSVSQLQETHSNPLSR